MKCIVCDRCKTIIENPRRCRVITCARPLKPRTVCDKGGKVGILMSREVYDMARLGDNAAYAVSIENFRSVYWGYDIYVIAENAPPIFSPVIVRFLEDFDLFQFDAGTFLISESDDGALRVFTKPTQDHAFFIETEFTVYQGRQTERVTFADRLRAGRDHPPRPWYNREGHTDWQDLMRYAIQPD